MARRPLVATMLTTLVGTVVGAGLGALVGRMIALVGDETVQTSVPMVFCGALGYFVGGASAAKGSLERFGASRAGVGAAVATVILVLLVGGAFLSRAAGSVVFVVGIVAAVLAGAAAAAVGGPRDAPVAHPRARVPQPSPRDEVAASQPPAPPIPKPVTSKVAVPPRSEVRDEPEPRPEPKVGTDAAVNWSLDQETPEPPSRRPRRDRPLRKGDA